MNTNVNLMMYLRRHKPLSTAIALLLFSVVLSARLSTSWVYIFTQTALAEPLGEQDTPSIKRCGQDRFEPNNIRGRARNISPSMYKAQEVEARSCSGDEDWYTIWLDRGQQVELRLEGDEVGRWPGLSVFAPLQRSSLGLRERSQNVQSIKVRAHLSGRYRVKVRGRGDEPARYYLRMRRLN